MRQATTKPKLFLDSSGLISAIISKNPASSMRRIIMLGEAGVLDLRISREVMGDTERFIRARNEQMLPMMAQAITEGKIGTTQDPNKDTIDFCETLTGYRPDARILAAAIEVDADILVTNDSTHLLGNPKIAPPKIKVMTMTPTDALAWCFEYWMEARG